MNISLSAFAPENLVSRDGFGSPVPRRIIQRSFFISLPQKYTKKNTHNGEALSFVLQGIQGKKA